MNKSTLEHLYKSNKTEKEAAKKKKLKYAFALAKKLNKKQYPYRYGRDYTSGLNGIVPQ